jgi:hypothetical protein
MIISETSDVLATSALMSFDINLLYRIIIILGTLLNETKFKIIPLNLHIKVNKLKYI